MVYDDWFETVSNENQLVEVQNQGVWERLFRTSRTNLYDREDFEEGAEPAALSEDWLNQEELQQQRQQQNSRPRPWFVDPTLVQEDPNPDYAQVEDEQQKQPALAHQQPAPVTQQQLPCQQLEGIANPPGADHQRRSAQVRKPNQRYFDNNYESISNDYVNGLFSNNTFLATLSFHTPASNYESKQLAAFFRQHTDDDGLLLDWHSLAFAAKANSDDLPTYWEAMKSPDAEGFMDAMTKEVMTLESMGAWEIVDRPVGKNVLPGAWALRRKRYPDG